MTAQLAEFLRLARKDKEKNLREVELKTGISNAYLSQLERGVAKKPSPSILRTLADYYGCQYEDLMRLAGYIKSEQRANKPQDHENTAAIALMSTGLNAEQVKQIMEYANYVRQQPEARKRTKG
jgi:transcriptional regulator with XRE-family HTH domain